VTGKNRIMIYGPKDDGTYVVEFRTAAGEAPAISIPRTEAPVIQHFQGTHALWVLPDAQGLGLGIGALTSNCRVCQSLSKRAFKSGRRHRWAAGSYAPNSEQNSQYDQLNLHFSASRATARVHRTRSSMLASR